MKALVLILIITCLSYGSIYSLDSINGDIGTMVHNSTLDMNYVPVALCDSVMEGGTYILLDSVYVYNDSLTIIQYNKIVEIRKAL